MKRFSGICSLWAGVLALLSAACRPVEDLRYAAPCVSFERADYTVAAESGGADLFLVLDRPAKSELSVRLSVESTLEEGTQYTLPPLPLTIAAGSDRAPIHLSLNGEAILALESEITLSLQTGIDYGVDPYGAFRTCVRVTKEWSGPVLRFVAPTDKVTVQAFLTGSVACTVAVSEVQDTAMNFALSFGELVEGVDFTLNGDCVLPPGSSQTSFVLNVLRHDQGGLDRTDPIALVPQPGSYAVAAVGGDFSLRLVDPVPDFRKLLRTPALQNGSGFQVRQAIRTPAGAESPEGGWDGNTTVDLGPSAEGSPYLRNYRNMYNHPSFVCMANSATSQWLRMSDLFPNRIYPSPVAILDYGNDQGHRQFSPADSVLRFCPNPDAPETGTVVLTRPRSFTAFVGSYADWQDRSAGNLAWVLDSRANGGDIFASTHPAITGTLSVTVERIEGTYDFNDADGMVRLSVWMRSSSDQFLMDGDALLTRYAIEQVEPGLWKLQYKLWPR